MEHYKNKVFPLTGKVQHYAWGGTGFLSSLLHMENPDKKPFAEYWLGAHKTGASSFFTGEKTLVKLDKYLAAFPDETIGKAVNQRFRHLPFLLKILDVKEMLSIQVHPTRENAVKEFESENKNGIPLDAPNRNYKDDNHKPELMVALGEFWLLHGFKSEGALENILANVPELSFLSQVFKGGNYRELYKTVMSMGQEEVNSTLQPLLNRILPLYNDGKLKKSDEHFWTARAALTYNQPGKIDRGIFSIYFFNLVHMNEGDAIFQDAGVPHAYLEGQNVEIMANSDNVLRGGLTPKYVDVDELMKHVVFAPTQPDLVPGTGAGDFTKVYITPAPDFELSKIEMKAGDELSLNVHSTEIFLVMNGKINVQETGPGFLRQSGQSFVAFDKAALRITANTASVIFKAAVPG
jgi:mannose-6-phosphate isomerase